MYKAHILLMVKYFVHIVCSSVAVELYIYTWNRNDPCFKWKGISFGGFKPHNRGQKGSRYNGICFLFMLSISSCRSSFVPFIPYFLMIPFNDFARRAPERSQTFVCVLFTSNSQRKNPIRNDEVLHSLNRIRL